MLNLPHMNALTRALQQGATPYATNRYRVIAAGLAAMPLAPLLFILISMAWPDEVGTMPESPLQWVALVALILVAGQIVMVPAMLAIAPIWLLLHWRGAGLTVFATVGGLFGLTVPIWLNNGYGDGLTPIAARFGTIFGLDGLLCAGAMWLIAYAPGRRPVVSSPA